VTGSAGSAAEPGHAGKVENPENIILTHGEIAPSEKTRGLADHQNKNKQRIL